MENILITGGAGFIGSHLAARLLAAGHKVVAADDFTLGCRANVAACLDDVNFTLVQQDVAQITALQKLMEQHHIDRVYHLAAKRPLPRHRPRKDFRDHICGAGSDAPDRLQKALFCLYLRRLR